jgi:CheY-like chemotaxis protein
MATTSGPPPTAPRRSPRHRPTAPAILLDIGLPGLDGYEVARRLRGSSCPDGTTLLIAVSGYGQEEDRRKSREAGFDLHLVKPVHFDELTDILNAARPPMQGRVEGSPRS